MAADTGGLTATVAAPRDTVLSALLDVESYPRWQTIMKSCVVLERDGAGRPLLAEFTVDAKVRTVRYVSRYRYDLPAEFAWDLERGDLVYYVYSNSSEPIVRKVVAVPGDKFEVVMDHLKRGWALKVDGELYEVNGDTYYFGSPGNTPALKLYQDQNKGYSVEISYSRRLASCNKRECTPL